jgi:hypothetical protein
MGSSIVRRRLNALQEVSRTKNLQAIIEAVTLIGIGKAMAVSREAIQEALALLSHLSDPYGPV